MVAPIENPVKTAVLIPEICVVLFHHGLSKISLTCNMACFVVHPCKILIDVPNKTLLGWKKQKKHQYNHIRPTCCSLIYGGFSINGSTPKASMFVRDFPL